MKIYLDLLWTQDSILMMLILIMVSQLTNRKIHLLRIVFVSALNGLLSVVTVVHCPQLINNWILKLCYIMGIVKIVFPYHAFHQYCTFGIVGIILVGIFSLLGGNLLCALGVWGGVFLWLRYQKRNQEKRTMVESTTCWIEFNWQGKNHYLKTMIDTGHHVKSRWNEEVVFVKTGILTKEGRCCQRKIKFYTISEMIEKEGVVVNNIIIKYGNSEWKENVVMVETSNIQCEFDAIISYELIRGGMLNGNLIINKTESA